MNARRRGFTLIEIMIALGVFALVSITVYARIGEILQQSRGLETRTLATWVAQNRLTALALEHRGTGEPVPAGRLSDAVTLGGRAWRVVTEISRTSDAELQRVEITVAEAAAADAAREEVAARLIGFIGRY